MILKSGEQKRREDKVIVEEFKWNEHSEESLQGEGNIFLTTQRLAMEREVGGKAITIFEFPLKEIDQVSLKGLISKVVLLRVILNQISSKIKGIDFSGKKGFANLKIKVNNPKAYADEISFRSKKEES